MNIFSGKSATEKAQAKLEKVKADIAGFEIRAAAIENEIAQNWEADNSKIEAEYAALSGRIRAGQQVLVQLEQDIKAAKKQDALTKMDAARSAQAVAAKQLTTADEKLLKAFEKFMAGPVAAWIEADTAYDAADRTIRGVNYECDRAGVSFEETSEITARYEYELQAKCRDLVQTLKNAGEPGERNAFRGITREQLAQIWNS